MAAKAVGFGGRHAYGWGPLRVYAALPPAGPGRIVKLLGVP
jgi:hypothetical protein